MHDLAGQIVDEAGWAGSVLWICTVDDFSVHLYDAPIELNGSTISIGDSAVALLAKRAIRTVVADERGFFVEFQEGGQVGVPGYNHETARIFRRGDLDSHYLYVEGRIHEDRG